MKLTALTAALSLVASVFLLSACDRGPMDQRAADKSSGSQSSSAGGTSGSSGGASSSPTAPKRSQSKP